MASGKRKGFATWQALVIGGGVVGFFLMPHRCTHDVDDSFFPYAMTGIRPEFESAQTGAITLGTISATYDGRVHALDECQAAARVYAEERRISDWSHICCTVTKESSCKTKVR